MARCWRAFCPIDLLQLSDRGITVTPPDPNANTRKMFVPRAVLAELKVLGVIGSPARKGRRKRPEPSRDQIPLFPSSVPAEPPA